MIKLTHIHTYSGPNIYSPEPSLVVSLEVAVDELERFARKVSLINHKFSSWFQYELPAGSVSELEVGKFLTSFALALLVEVRGFINVAGAINSNEGVKLILGFHEPIVSLGGLELASNIYCSIESAISTDVTKEIDKFWHECRKFHPDYQANILMRAAKLKNLPVLPFVGYAKYWQYGWGIKSRVFMESASNADGKIANDLSRNKVLSKSVFQVLGAPYPIHKLINSAEDLNKAVSSIGYPCVIKPLDIGGGKGVTAGITSDSQLEVAFNAARKMTTGPIMVESFLNGNDHRLMVVDGKFIAAIRREPSAVIGNGRSSIRELIQKLNELRSINLVKSNYLRPIKLDNILLEFLRVNGKNLETIVPDGEKVILRSNANLSTGGFCTDVTNKVHLEIQSLVEQLSTSIGFGAAGFDYITTDISLPPVLSGGAFIEMNTTPGLDATIAAGWTAEEIGSIVLGDRVGRIPIQLYVVDTLKNTLNDRKITSKGSATVFGTELDVSGCRYQTCGTHAWAAVLVALRNTSVKSLDIYCTPSEIISNGLPVDQIDKTTVSNNIQIPKKWIEVLQKYSLEMVCE